MTAVTFRQPRVLLSFALPAAVLWYMVTHAEGIADYAFVLGAAGLSLLLHALQLAARRTARSQAADEHQLFQAMFMQAAIGTTLAVCRNEYKYVADIELELGELPEVVCNIGELNQVFLNLIINAAQAIQEKVAATDQRGTIRITTRLDGSQAVFEIADDGPGIPFELQDRIYEPFFTTKELGKGSGQGLALARATIEQHSGSLECKSAPSEGTTFTVRLPLKPPSAEMAQAA